jgi:hypothetical protein
VTGLILGRIDHAKLQAADRVRRRPESDLSGSERSRLLSAREMKWAARRRLPKVTMSKGLIQFGRPAGIPVLIDQ